MMFCLVKERTVAVKLFITTLLITATRHVAPTHNTLLLCVSKWYEGEAMTDSRRTWCPCSVHIFKGEDIILQSCHQLALQHSQTLSIKKSQSVHWMLYCNLNNYPFKTEIMHQLNEQDKACHVAYKQLLNLLQEIQAYQMHSWCQMRHISIQVLYTNNIFNSGMQTTPADCKQPLHSLAYTW
jgi:hypothetical protein